MPSDTHTFVDSEFKTPYFETLTFNSELSILNSLCYVLYALLMCNFLSIEHLAYELPRKEPCYDCKITILYFLDISLTKYL